MYAFFSVEAAFVSHFFNGQRIYSIWMNEQSSVALAQPYANYYSGCWLLANLSGCTALEAIPDCTQITSSLQPF